VPKAPNRDPIFGSQTWLEIPEIPILNCDGVRPAQADSGTKFALLVRARGQFRRSYYLKLERRASFIRYSSNCVANVSMLSVANYVVNAREMEFFSERMSPAKNQILRLFVRAALQLRRS
jgi:hypothetical protein